ncbi:MAG: hypothetical protein ABL308_10740 [Oceanicaulis sp.]
MITLDFLSGLGADPRLVTARASRAWAPTGWSFTDGAGFGPLIGFGPRTARLVRGEGLLVEPASTNHLRNPRGEGASGATPPTHWAVGASGGMSWSFTHGTEQGWPYVDVTLSGTAVGDARLDFEGFTQIPALTGQDWTLSAGLRVISGAVPGDPKLGMFERASTGSTVTSALQSVTPDATRRRFVFSRTFEGGANVAAAHPCLYIDNPAGAVACVLRIYAPQMERAARASSPVLPPAGAPGAATRDADGVDLALPPDFDFQSFSLISEVALGPAPAAGTPFMIALETAAGTSDYTALYDGASGLTQRVNAGGSAAGLASVAPRGAAGAIRRFAMRCAPDDMAFAWDGGGFSADSSGGSGGAAYVRLSLGDVQGGSQWPGRIRQVRLTPDALDDAALQRLAG